MDGCRQETHGELLRMTDWLLWKLIKQGLCWLLTLAEQPQKAEVVMASFC